MKDKMSSPNETVDKIIKINDAIISHLSKCPNCDHLKGIIKKALLEIEFDR